MDRYEVLFAKIQNIELELEQIKNGIKIVNENITNIGYSLKKDQLKILETIIKE